MLENSAQRDSGRFPPDLSRELVEDAHGQPGPPAQAPSAIGRVDARGERAEQERLAALDRYDILDSPREEAFDRIARLTRNIFSVPMATVSVLDAHRQWHKSSEGALCGETPRQDTFCTQTIKETGPLVVRDAREDERFATNPYVVGEPHIRFYAGAPLQTHDGHNIGTLCIVDTQPREFGARQVEILSDLARIAMEQIELRQLASKDALTGALSRRAFKEEAEQQTALALRHHHHLSAIVLDLDHFKSVNDTYGHAAGDVVLARTVQACLKVLRRSDRLGRLGGEEFAILLPHTDLGAALEVAEKLRTAVANESFDFGSGRVGVTASFGVAALDGATRDSDTLLKNADAALYEAKAAGRNRSVAARTREQAGAKPRRRVLKSGQILFNNHASSMDCTVRSLSDDGAGLDVSSSVGIPKSFDLAIKADRFQKPCYVTSRTDKHLEVEFG